MTEIISLIYTFQRDRTLATAARSATKDDREPGLPGAQR